MATQCNDIESLLPTYLDGELASQDRLTFDHHMADCAACRDRVRAEGAYQARLRELLAPPAAPGHLAARVRDALAQEERRARSARWRERRAWALPGMASLAAAAALIVLVTNETGGPGGASQVSDRDVPHAPARGMHGVAFRPFVRSRKAAEPVNWLVVQALFDVPLRDGNRHQIRLEVLGCQNVDLRGYRRVLSAGPELWVSEGERNTVVYSINGGDTCMVFASEMELPQLVSEVVRSGLLVP